MTATYLGDGLYVEHDGYQVKLFTPHGNQVFLEPDVLQAFLKYIESINKSETRRLEK